MGIFSEYLDKNMSTEQLNAERKAQLQRIATTRKRDVLVIAADINKGQFGAPIGIDYSDLLPIKDQIENLKGQALDIILETPGGSGEVAEQIVKMIREKYEDVAVIVPGSAMSAGTIMAMAADEILMGTTSALGPIDAQIQRNGKVFSAHALLEGLEKIKKEVEEGGHLNKAFIPILQQISPGELQHAQNALDFAKDLVRKWLAKFKFKKWEVHSSTGKPVTEADRNARATEIADQLCDHSRWLTHGRALSRADLEGLRLRITDYEADPVIADAVLRYYVLLQMTMGASAIYKVFETPTSQIYRFVNSPVPPPQQMLPGGGGQAPIANVAIVPSKCLRCGEVTNVQANLGQPQPLQPGLVPFPVNNLLKCRKCGQEMDLSAARRQIEMQTRKPVVI